MMSEKVFEFVESEEETLHEREVFCCCWYYRLSSKYLLITISYICESIVQLNDLINKLIWWFHWDSVDFNEYRSLLDRRVTLTIAKSESELLTISQFQSKLLIFSRTLLIITISNLCSKIQKPSGIPFTFFITWQILWKFNRYALHQNLPKNGFHSYFATFHSCISIHLFYDFISNLLNATISFIRRCYIFLFSCALNRKPISIEMIQFIGNDGQKKVTHILWISPMSNDVVDWQKKKLLNMVCWVKD